MDRADSLSEANVGRDSPTGLREGCDGHSWYLEALVCDCRLTMEGLFSKV